MTAPVEKDTFYKDTIALQKHLDNLQRWEREWIMTFNPMKCEIIARGETASRLHDQELSFVKNGKYLRVYIAEDLSWNAQVDTTSKKTNNSLTFLRRNLARCLPKLNTYCYKTLTRLMLEYTSKEWNPYTISKINQSTEPQGSLLSNSQTQR